MNPVQTGIAVASAIGLVALIFIVPAFASYLAPVTAPADVASSTAPLQFNTEKSMPQENATELKVTDETVGTGATAQAGDTVTVNYVGALTNGTVFDASANHGQPFSFTLGAGQVIKGWDQGLLGMKEGGKRTLVIPASLAYGDQAIGNVIPANSTLIFEVELVKVTKGK